MYPHDRFRCDKTAGRRASAPDSTNVSRGAEYAVHRIGGRDKRGGTKSDRVRRDCDERNAFVDAVESSQTPDEVGGNEEGALRIRVRKGRTRSGMLYIHRHKHSFNQDRIAVFRDKNSRHQTRVNERRYELEIERTSVMSLVCLVS